MNHPDHPQVIHGIRDNLHQFAHQLGQVFLVGLTLGMLRTVVPALAASEFGAAEGSFMVLATFVVAFGFVKGTLNFVAGRLAETLGRRRVLLLGWLAALPIPAMVYFAPSWGWIVAATVLLGVNQGLCWSMTQTAKMDITRPDERGLTMGLNEFAGYLGVATAGIATGYLAMGLGPRLGLLLFGALVIALALLLVLTSVRETHAWAKVEGGQTRSTLEVFALMSWRDRRMAAFCQAGLVEKFVDALVWLFYPVFLYQQGLDLAGIGWVAGIYGFVWGGSQFLTGKLSDHIGRLRPIIWGMWLCGGGVALTLLGSGIYWWSFSAAVTGFGMALLYPNLSAAVADLADASWRSSAIGIYRFWRDIGYGIGALALGLVAQLGNAVAAGFWFVAVAMFVSGLIVMAWGRRPTPGCGESGNRKSQKHHSRTAPLAQNVAQVILDQSIVQVGRLPHESYQLL